VYLKEVNNGKGWKKLGRRNGNKGEVVNGRNGSDVG